MSIELEDEEISLEDLVEDLDERLDSLDQGVTSFMQAIAALMIDVQNALDDRLPETRRKQAFGRIEKINTALSAAMRSQREASN